MALYSSNERKAIFLLDPFYLVDHDVSYSLIDNGEQKEVHTKLHHKVWCVPLFYLWSETTD